MARENGQWTFLTNYGHVLLCIASDPGVRLRDIAARVGITERAAQRIVTDLVDSGYISRTRVGRRNVYEVHHDRPLRHELIHDRDVGEFLTVLAHQPARAKAS
jgi:DNA-binding Lrp family transcriptional regulator